MLAQAAYDNLQAIGAPVFNRGAARDKAREIQRKLGLEPMDDPFLAATEQLITPQEAEAELRRELPAWQEHFTSDDYTEYCWHAPTVRLYIARPTLAAPPGYKYPAWAMNALGGIRETIEPMIACAAKTIGCTLIDLLTDAAMLSAARQEFEQRTGGGVGGSNWQAPLCDYPPPVDFRWPEYVTTARGREWWIPG